MFIFSRNACDDAVVQCRDAGLRFTDAEERLIIRSLVEERTAHLADADLDVLGYDGWLASLEMGIAAHHAGLIPAFKEVTETCFTAGLVKVVFATETLALGRQHAGAIGRHRADDEVQRRDPRVPHARRSSRSSPDEPDVAASTTRASPSSCGRPFVPFDQLSSLAASRSFPLRSAFRATYNMAANLVRRYDRVAALEVLEPLVRPVPGRPLLGRTPVAARGRTSAVATSWRRPVRCERGDVEEYAQLVERAERARRGPPGSAKAIEESVALLRPGDVVDAPDPRRRPRGRHLGRLPGQGLDPGARASTSTARWVSSTSATCGCPIRPVGRIELPVPYAPGERSFRRTCADAARPGRRAGRIRSHPRTSRSTRPRRPWSCTRSTAAPTGRRTSRHGAGLRRVTREIEDLQSSMARRSGSVVRRFESVVALLERRGYVAEWSLTAAGARLAAIYHECDLLLAEAIDAGLLEGLDAAELAAMVSCVTYEERRPDAPGAVRAADRRGRPSDQSARVAWRRPCGRTSGAAACRRPASRTPASSTPIHAWVSGVDLERVLEDERAPGDFVRNVKVVIDLLGQLGGLGLSASTTAAAPRGRRRRARAASSPRRRRSGLAPARLAGDDS